ncbi:MAG: hypothetical protein IJ109_09000 [Firmicutes bacterium]|nr:hypothetical protein [Bacillota bacterium]
MNGLRRISKYLGALLTVVALAAAVFGGGAMLSQPAAAAEGEHGITVNEGVPLEKFEGQDNYWMADLKYNEDGDKSGDVLIYTLEDPANVPVGMEINIKFTANKNYSVDLLQVQGRESGKLIDLNLEETDEGWNGTFLMPEEDVDITAYTQENRTESADGLPRDSWGEIVDAPQTETSAEGFTVNGRQFVEQEEGGIWYYEFDEGTIYLDDTDTFTVVRTELKDKDSVMNVVIRNHETGELYTSCGSDESVEFLKPDADMDIEVSFDSLTDWNADITVD